MKNAQLWKRILNEGIYSWGKPDVAKWLDNIAKKIISAPIIVDRRPCDDTAMVGQSIDLTGRCGVSMPFEVFWIEQAIKDTDLIAGVLFQGKFIEESEWSGQCYCFLSKPQSPLAFNGRTDFSVLGGIVSASSKVESFNFLGTEDGRWCANTCSTSMSAAVDTLTMLGCSNVSLQPHDNDPKEVRRATKRHGVNANGYRYHTLVVRPAGSKPGTPGQEIGTMPRHVCRGHFQYNGPAAIHGHPDGRDRGLLFGRYAGRFFIPPTVKGNIKNGIVEKDYEIRSA